MNTLLTMQHLTNESLVVLENSLKAAKRINREYDDKFAVSGAKIGAVANVRMPPRYTVSTGQALDLQNATETSVPVKLDSQFHVDFSFSSQDLALSIDNFSKRFLAPAVTALANKIDAAVLGLYKKVANHVGTFGTTPTDLETYLLAGAKLDDSAVPQSERSLALSPLMQVKAVKAGISLFAPANVIGEQYKSGQMAQALGFGWYLDQNVPTHTLGTPTGTPLTNGTTASGAVSVVTDGWTSSSGSLKEGDIVSFEGVYAINPVSYAPLSYLKQFVVTADVACTSGNDDITIPISPAMIFSGSQQTCYCAAGYLADGKYIKVFDTAQAGLAALATTATSAQALAFHPDFGTLACADLPLPKGPDMAARQSDKQLGLSIRLIRDYDIQTDQWPCRMDILCGVSILRPELACRVSG